MATPRFSDNLAVKLQWIKDAMSTLTSMRDGPDLDEHRSPLDVTGLKLDWLHQLMHTGYNRSAKEEIEKFAFFSKAVIQSLSPPAEQDVYVTDILALVHNLATTLLSDLARAEGAGL
jgi:hypothetical protein